MVLKVLSITAAGFQAVHHQVKGVLLVLVEFDLLRQVAHLAIHPHTGKAIRLGCRKDVLEGTLALPGQRRQHLEARPGRQVRHLGDDLLGRLGKQAPPAGGAVGHTHPGEQHAQVIGNFCDRCHGGAGVAADRLLLNGNGRAEAADIIDLGLFHLADELARKSGE